MRTLCRAFVALVCICGVTAVSSSTLFAEEPSKAPVEKKVLPTKAELFTKENIQKLSESLGHFIYKSLDNPFLTLNADGVIKGLKEAKEGKVAPMTEQQYEELLQKMQEVAFDDMSKTNLKEAEQFLEKNKSKKGVQELEAGKLQMEVLAPGSGDEKIDEKSTVKIHYDGTYINGKSFSSSKEMGEPVSITLSQTIPGFKKGMLGMKVGEKRRLFIHPDLGYGTSGQLLPNALLIFEVEAVKIEPPAPPAKEGEEASTAQNEDGLDDDLADANDGDDEDNGDDLDDLDDEVPATPVKK